MDYLIVILGVAKLFIMFVFKEVKKKVFPRTS